MLVPEWIIVAIGTLLLGQLVAGLKWGISMASKQNELAYRMELRQSKGADREYRRQGVDRS